ncbi:MAG: hypothetical protein ACX93I_14115 [Winogradskyella sp.]
MKEKKIIHRIQVTGKTDEEHFKRVRENILRKVEEVFNSILEESDDYIEFDDTKKLTEISLEFLEKKVKNNTAEDYKKIAEIEALFSKAEKNKAATRDLDFNTRKAARHERLRDLKLKLTLGRFLLLGDKGEESIIFVKNIDNLIIVIDSIQEERKLS